MLTRRLSLLLPLFFSSSPLRKRESGVAIDPTAAIGQTFDYVIVGGGTAGLTVAAHLSEDPSNTMLVIEAGNDDHTNPDVYDIIGLCVDSSCATYPTSAKLKITQLGHYNRCSGRTLGGCSSINGLVWSRGVQAQYDAFSRLQEEDESFLNWDFESLFSYMKKAETFTPPDEQQRRKGASYAPEYHPINQ